MTELALLALQGFYYALIARALLSWFPTPSGLMGRFADVLRQVTEPVLAPIRRVLPPLRIGGASLDLSVLVAIIAVRVLSIMIAA